MSNSKITIPYSQWQSELENGDDWSPQEVERMFKKLLDRDSTIVELGTTIHLILDMVDYQRGACSITEMVGGVLPVHILERARAALELVKKEQDDA